MVALLASAVTVGGGVPSAAADPAPAGWQVVPAANQAYGSGYPGPLNPRLNSTSCVSGTCMAVGSTDVTDGAVAMAESNANGRWELSPAVADPLGTGDAVLDSVSCASVSSCVAVGGEGDSGYATPSGAPLSEKWDGSNWSVMPTPDPGGQGAALYGVSCPSSQTCFGVGQELADPATGLANAMIQRLAPATGEFVNPAAGVAPSSTDPKGVYTASFDSQAGTVTVMKGSTTVLTAPASSGGFGFSPAGNGFVAEQLDGNIFHVNLYNLNAPDPSTAVWSTGPTVTSGRVEFSPSGHYLLLGYTTASQTFLELADATALNAADDQVFTSGGFAPSAPPGSCSDTCDTFASAAYGFAPDDSRFSYAYLDASGQVQWRWTDLAVPAPQPIYSFQTSSASAYSEFSPGGDALAIVTGGGTGGGSVSIEAFSTSSGADLGSAGPVSTSNAVDLHATATDYVATINSTDYTLAPNTDLKWTAIQNLPTPPKPADPPGYTIGAYDGDFLGGVSCVSASDCVAVGAYAYKATTTSGFQGPSDVGGSLIMHWDGTSWSIVFHPVADAIQLGIGQASVSCTRDASASTGDACVVVGGYGTSSTEMITLAADGDWSDWKEANGPRVASGFGYLLSGVSCTSASACTAVGTYRPGGQDGSNALLALRYDGSGWSIEPTPYQDLGSFLNLTGVSCWGSDQCVAVGLGGAAAYGPAGIEGTEGALVIAEGDGWDTGITVTPSVADYGQSMTFHASLTGPGPAPSGAFVFSDGGPVCTATMSDGSATCTATLPGGGTQTISGDLVFGTGNGKDAALSGLWTQVVDVAKAPTSVSASASPGSVTVGASVTYGASVTSPGGSTWGTVTFSVGSTTLCTATLSSGSGSCASTAAPIGTDTVTASYSGNGNDQASSATAPLTVARASNAAASATAVSVSPDTVTQGKTVTYSATVSGASGTPTGSVDFSAAGTELCAATLSGGTGKCVSNAAPAGADTVTGTYSGDVAYDTSFGNVALQVNATSTEDRLFVGNANDTITSYPASESGDIAPAATISSGGAHALNGPDAAAFDAGGDLWVANCGSGTLVKYGASQLGATGAPAPAVTIGTDAGGSLACPSALAFDPSGNLWVANFDGNDIVEYTASQLASSGQPTPALMLSATSSAYCVQSIDGPTGIAFDSVGNLWVASNTSDCVAEFGASQLGASGAPAPLAVMLSTFPEGLAFDSGGDLWTANDVTGGELQEFTPAQLAALGTSGSDPSPVVRIDSGPAGELQHPHQLAFDGDGNLWVVNAGTQALSEYTPEQLAQGGVLAPADVIVGLETGMDTPAAVAVGTAQRASGTVSLDHDSVSEGDTVTYTASVAAVGGGQDPTGSVTFSTHHSALCTATLSGGSASCTATTAPIGTDTISGAYSGDAQYNAALLSSATLTVSPARTSTAVSVDPSPPVQGRDTIYRVLVTSSQGTPDGTVNVHVGSENLCEAYLGSDGTGSCIAAAPDQGGQTITADYSGSSEFAASSGTAQLDVQPGASLPPSVYVANRDGGSVTSYQTSAAGNALAETTIGGLSTASALALDGTGDLWVADCSGYIEEYTPSQLAQTGAPTPAITISNDGDRGDLGCPSGLAFDRQGDLWVSSRGSRELVEYTPQMLASGGSPAPAVIIGNDGAGDLSDPQGIAFDAAGNLWVAAQDPNAVVEYAASDLAASGTPTPAVRIGEDGSGALAGPSQLTFDAQGDLWVSGAQANDLVEYVPAQLDATGTPSPHVVIADDGSGALAAPAQLAFDDGGSLWVASPGDNAVLRYAAGQLGQSGSPMPAATIAGGDTQLSGPDGLAVPRTPPVATAPTKPRALAAGAGDRSVTLTWSPPASDGGSPVTGYQLLESSSANGAFNEAAAPTGTSDTVTGLTNGTTYYFEVEALNGAGTSAPSDPVSATPSAPTTTALSSSANPSATGRQVTYTATVTPNPGGGTVAFTDAGASITGCGAAAINAGDGTATCTVTYTTPSGHPIQAGYTGSASFGGSRSPALTEVVTAAGAPGPAGTSTRLGSSANPAVTGQQVTYTATVAPAPDGGSVRFLDGGQTIVGCDAVAVDSATGQATCRTSYGTPGPHGVQAAYSGDARFAASQSTTLTQTVSSSAVLRGTPSAASGAVILTVSCAPQSGGCRFTGSLTATETVHGRSVSAVTANAGRGHRSVTVGTKTVTVAAGKTTTVTIALNATGRRLLAQFKRLPVRLTVSLATDGQRTTVAVRKLTVKPPKRPARKA